MSDSNVVVVDANLALKWAILEPDSDRAMMLLDKWNDEGKTIIAPALFAYEVTNIIYRQALASKLTYDEAKQGLRKLFAIGVLLQFSLYQNISVQAMEFAHRFGLAATYDTHYLALAHHENCEFWTADTRLWNAVKGKLDWVHTLKDYQP